MECGWPIMNGIVMHLRLVWRAAVFQLVQCPKIRFHRLWTHFSRNKNWPLCPSSCSINQHTVGWCSNITESRRKKNEINQCYDCHAITAKWCCSNMLHIRRRTRRISKTKQTSNNKQSEEWQQRRKCAPEEWQQQQTKRYARSIKK